MLSAVTENMKSREFLEKQRKNPQDFTRNRKLSFVKMMLFSMNLAKSSLQKELTSFFSLFSSDSSKQITKSAYCQSRLKLKHTAFIELSDQIIQLFYSDDEHIRWNGFRLLAIDGSRLQLPKSNEILNEFGYAQSRDSVFKFPMAQISTCYDILNNLIIDSQIKHYKTSELDLAELHLKKAKEKDLLLYDRGYGATWFFYLHIIRNFDFVVRLQKGFLKEIDKFWESEEESKVVNISRVPRKSQKKLDELGLKFKVFKIRLVKVILDTGEIEVLATSLLDEKKYHTSIFKDLYAKRWGVEVNYDHLKNNIEVENFTGLSALSIKQDFFANVFILNIQALFIRDAQEEMQKEKHNTKYEYKVNRNLSLGYMKDRVVQIMMSDDPNYLKELKELFKIEPVPIRKGRKVKRKDKRSGRKYHMNKKRAF